MTHADVVATAKPALRRDRARASHVVEERQVINVRDVGSTPAGQARELDREQRVSQGALRRHVVREIGGERNCREELGQAQAVLRPRLVDYVAPPAVPIIRPLSAPAGGATHPSSGRKPEQSKSIARMPSGPTLTNATCSIISRDCPPRLSLKRQLRRFRTPIRSRCESRTSKSEAGENQCSKRRAISSRPELTSVPRGHSNPASTSGARHSANRPKSRVEGAGRNASGADSCIRPTVAPAHSGHINRSVHFSGIANPNAPKVKPGQLQRAADISAIT